ncbi:hypothetical protein [Allorhizobium ampelinum]|uniref:hypothetical protein n=1 Tax=Allorhizobium ampelinum TaxID=3025782 RepID=UPI001F1FB56C|nr:hypothetical protein [Allorhizobium ampelinum]
MVSRPNRGGRHTRSGVKNSVHGDPHSCGFNFLVSMADDSRRIKISDHFAFYASKQQHIRAAAKVANSIVNDPRRHNHGQSQNAIFHGLSLIPALCAFLSAGALVCG